MAFRRRRGHPERENVSIMKFEKVSMPERLKDHEVRKQEVVDTEAISSPLSKFLVRSLAT